jgi:hypothetical protein
VAAADDRTDDAIEDGVAKLRKWAEHELDRRIFAHRRTLAEAPEDLALDAMTIVMLGSRGSGNDSLTREQLALVAAAAVNRLVKA